MTILLADLLLVFITASILTVMLWILWNFHIEGRKH